jgi:preprotein translocase, secA subunit
VDEKNMQVVLSEQGHEHAEQILTQLGLLQENESLYASNNIMLMHHLMAALRAHTLFHRDQHYVVKPNEEGQPEIVIVDEHTGRLMDGRRWSDGLHQAVEAKEGVEVQKENQTLASITFQNYFRLYTKLSGMTGTADTEAYEFQSIYGLETVIIPTNKPIQRKDFNDQIFRTAEEKYEAVVKDIKDCYERGQPVLVGTTTIENSELVSHLLKREGLPHNVLNAKEHEREALIVAQAGKPKMITVATNMAGRGTDIVLGGNVQHQADAIRADESLTDEQKQAQIQALEDSWEAGHQAVVDAGGLHIIGTERHESRRIDNQLRGRAGRQGDPGSSRFYLSFEDPLLRLFALDRAAAILNRLAPEPGVAIEANILTRQIENAQRKVEGRNFDMRKQVLEYDDVANDQRRVLYHQRNEILGNKDISEMLQEWRATVIGGIVDMYMPADSMEEQWDIPAMMAKLAGEFNVHVDVSGWLKEDNTLENEEVKERVLAQVDAEYQAKKDLVGDEVFSNFERSVVLQVVDTQWREHLAAMDYLRQGIGLRGYAQKDPKQEYKREAFAMFQNLWNNIQYNATSILVSAQIQPHQPEPETIRQPENAAPQAWSNVENGAFDPANPTEEDKQFFPDALEARGIAVHRNDPCPCGSGLKYKQCHGRLV